MTRPLLFVLAALAFMVSAPVAQAQPADIYVVQPGDTLYRISRANGLTVEELRALNELEGNTIEVGQPLRLNRRVPIPTVAPPEPPSTDGVGEPIPDRPTAGTPPTLDGPPERGPASGAAVHVVAAGETLFRIALRYGTTVEDLRRLNGIQGDVIEVGQRLVVGAGSGTPRTDGATRPVQLGTARAWSIDDTAVPADLVHVVEPGETLFSIAAALDLDVDALARSNALSTAPLQPGTLLYLPEARNPALAARTEMAAPDEEGLALVYPDVMRGRPTASGEPYDPLAFTMSHRDLPFGTVVLVTNPQSGRSTFARVVDRGPVSRAYLVELSAAAATALDLDPNAARRVEVRQLP